MTGDPDARVIRPGAAACPGYAATAFEAMSRAQQSASV